MNAVQPAASLSARRWTLWTAVPVSSKYWMLRCSPRGRLGRSEGDVKAAQEQPEIDLFAYDLAGVAEVLEVVVVPTRSITACELRVKAP